MLARGELQSALRQRHPAMLPQLVHYYRGPSLRHGVVARARVLSTVPLASPCSRRGVTRRARPRLQATNLLLSSSLKLLQLLIPRGKQSERLAQDVGRHDARYHPVTYM